MIQQRIREQKRQGRTIPNAFHAGGRRSAAPAALRPSVPDILPELSIDDEDSSMEDDNQQPKYDYDSENDEIVVRMNPWQASVVDRVTSRCRDQKSFLLYHRMGAGKTISMLMIMHNIPKSVRRVIFAPRSILTDTYNAGGDLRFIYKSMGHVAWRASQLELYPIDGAPVVYEAEPSRASSNCSPRAPSWTSAATSSGLSRSTIWSTLPHRKALRVMRRALSGALRIIGRRAPPLCATSPT